jgi:hypothetical protein
MLTAETATSQPAYPRSYELYMATGEAEHFCEPESKLAMRGTPTFHFWNYLADPYTPRLPYSHRGA